MAAATPASSLPGGGKFFLALVLFGLAYFLMPSGAQPWFALVIILGALLYAANTGAITIFEGALK